MIEFILGMAAVVVIAVIIWFLFRGAGRRSTTGFDEHGNKIMTPSHEAKFGNVRVIQDIPKEKKVVAKNEHYYNQLIADDMGAEASVRLDNGLVVDLMTKTRAYEIDFGGAKIYEGIGQALVYAFFTGLKPGLIILIRDKKEDKLYNTLLPALDYYSYTLDMDLIIYRVTDRIEGSYTEYNTEN